MIDRYDVVNSLDFERLAGSAGELRARQIITNYLDELDVSYEVEPFDLHGFDAGTATVGVGDVTVEATPFGLQATGRIEGPIVYVEQPDILKYSTGAFDGKIVLSYGMAGGLADLLSETEILAYIAISSPHKGATSLSHRQKRFEEKLSKPCLTVSYDDGKKLTSALGSAEKGGAPTAIVTIEQTVERRSAHNIVVSLGEATLDENVVYLVAHYDSVARSHGSTDNAGGTACVLELIQYFAKNPPKRRLRAILFSGEELGLLGSFAYVQQHEEEIRARGRFVVNIDVAGDPIGHDTFHVLGTREAAGWVAGVAREEGHQLGERLGVYSSDNVPFAVHEIPSASIARGGGEGSYFIHTAEDVARYVAPPGLDSPFFAARTVLNRLLNASIFPLRREIDDGMKEKLEKYLYRVKVEKPELQWRDSFKKP